MAPRSYLFLPLIALTAVSCVTSKKYYQDVQGPQFYEAVKGTQFNIVKLVRGSGGGFMDSLSNEFKLAPRRFFFNIVTTKRFTDTSRDYTIVQLSFPNFKTLDSSAWDRVSKRISPEDTLMPPEYISKTDNGKIFWMRKDDFENLEKENYIKKYYRRSYPSFAYGGNLSVPFKMRPATGSQYMKITPDFSLGGYAGCRFRLSRYEDFSLTLPVLTLGVTTLGLNSNNTIYETRDTAGVQQDALVLGRTISVGMIVQYNSFQFALIAGWDKASGELGRKWIYNDRPWYSFSIGFDFLNLERKAK